MITRRTGIVFLGLAVLLALALGLWFGAFQRQEAAASPGIDLVITKTASPAEPTLVVQGGTVTYTLEVRNVGTTDATGAVIRDTLGAGLTFVSITGGLGVTCPAPVGQTVDCTANVAANGAETRTVTIVARVTAAAGATVLNGAYVDPLNAITPEDNEDADDRDTGHECPPVGEGNDVDPDTEPDNFDCTVHTVGTVNLTITKTAVPADGSTVSTGGTITYTITVGNSASATGTATDVAVRDTFETPTKVSLTNVAFTPPDSCSDTALPDINCTIASLAPGISRTITVTATVTAGAGATILNGARVDRDNAIPETAGTPPGPEDAGDLLYICTSVDEGNDPGGDTSEPDNFDCTSHTVTSGTPDLTITKTASTSETSGVDTGDPITYTLTVRNESGATATASNVTIRDWLGTGLTFVSLTGGTGVTCPADTVSPFDCTVTSIAPGESRTATLVATVSASSGSVMNGARVDPDGLITESNEDADDQAVNCTATLGEGTDSGSDTERDNYDCTEHGVGEAAGLNLTLTKTATPAETVTVATGDTITYTITVSASGGTASSVVIDDSVGTGLTLASVTPGSGVTCSDTAGPDITCTAATVAAGTPRTVTLVATVAATSGTVLNGAEVDPGDTVTETNEDADDQDVNCTSVGEGTDSGTATEPDNFDCTSHTVGAAAGTRTFTLSPAGWHNFVWTGASGTAPETALACIAGKYQIAYEWVDSLQAWERYVPGCQPAELCNMDPLTQYDPLLVLITAENVTCTMTVAS